MLHFDRFLYTNCAMMHGSRTPDVEGCLYVWLVDVFRHTVPDNVHQLHVQKPSTYEKPEAASEVLGS